MENESDRESTEDDEGRRLLGAVLVALVSYVAVEIVNGVLSDPIGGYHRWHAEGGNGNYTTRAGWFFLLVGGWLYLGAPYLGCRALWKAARETGLSTKQRGIWVAMGIMLLAALARLLQMGFLSGALAWS